MSSWLGCLSFCAAAAPQDAPPPDWSQGVFMEVFVRGYQDSDGDGIGDLRGLTRRLDYLQRLGVTGLWLMPITRSADHDHGYAITDFRGIEPDYGSQADFDELLRQAHRRGIGVVMDYILNHSAREHPNFQDSLRHPQSPYRDWYVWQDPAPVDLKDWDIWGHTPWYADPDQAQAGARYFATFGPHMPDFNLRNPAVIDYHRDSLRFWLDRGLDGFRLDAVPHLIENSARDWNDQPESRALTAEYTRLIRSYPGRFTVCEATASPTAYASPEVCGSAFDFGLEKLILGAVRGEAEALAPLARHFETTPLNMATMLANHDIFAGARVWDQLGGDEARYRLAAATYLLLPGIPFLYYGEEIGMAGIEGPGDVPLRAPMSWSADARGFTQGRPFRAVSPNAATHNAQAQARDPASLLNHYRALIGLRRAQPALKRGDYVQAFQDGSVIGFQRRAEGQTLLVLINYGMQAWQGLPAGISADQRLRPLLRSAAQARLAAARHRRPAALLRTDQLRLPPQSFAVYSLQ
ncbi:DUF3459 domain-containing protein [Mitsuaria sp. WAJ17]|uniref:alpha-amylase family glycosyl hydrolase n=1 Tax=Mitsuaria sp. WAJ17 TaxID=2761452 RepID=UPI001602B98B|nr:alpha-amylase family glycosyl hydrolase [Mitsuaria sp. WAJ17]MBB2485800.1 DUF3459 domain-containing protein [Mitsuaria sp. WAJ17]